MSRRVGVISDTHGLLRLSAKEILKTCDLIIHAGDICGQEIIDALESIQHTVFVRGNMDRTYPGRTLRESEVVEFAGKHFYVLHNIYALDLEPKEAGMDAVIYGHSHCPDIFFKNGVLFLNPGSIGPKRFTLPIAMAIIDINDLTMHPEIITLPE
jgi:uncharacterized protein